MKWCKIFFPHFLLWSHQFSALTPLKQPLNWSADHYYKTKMSNAVGGWGGTQIVSTFFTHSVGEQCAKNLALDQSRCDYNAGAAAWTLKVWQKSTCGVFKVNILPQTN